MSDCDKALHIFWKGRYAKTLTSAVYAYEKAIELCPGFIRPYELVGNHYRKQGLPDKAIAYFEKAAQLGSTNYKLYYLLASLMFEKDKLDEASRYLHMSLNLRDDYRDSLELKRQIDKALDPDGPRLTLFEPAVPSPMILVHRYASITIRGLATDKSGVDWVRINDTDVELNAEGHFFKDVPLEPGKNLITLTAADQLGNQSAASVIVKRETSTLAALSEADAADMPETIYEKSIAVIIGINAYENYPVLEFAINDARAVEQEFREQGFEEVITIVDQQATQRRILTELFHNLPRKTGRDDRVVFYFAGHGQTRELPGGGRQGYIIPVDAAPFDVETSAISMDQIRSLSYRIAAKHILYVMDCCYSGLGLSRSFGISTGLDGYLLKVASMRAVQIVTAGGKGEQALEKEGHGVFTTYFLQAIAGAADVNRDKVVTGSELGTYLRPAVSNASRQAQTPLFGRLEGEGEVLFFVKN
jgi:hypothetical protein